MMKNQKSRRNQEQLIRGARRNDEGHEELWSMKTWIMNRKAASNMTCGVLLLYMFVRPCLFVSERVCCPKEPALTSPSGTPLRRPRLLQPQLLHPRLRRAKLRHPRLRNDCATKARLQRQGAILDSLDQPRLRAAHGGLSSWDNQRLPAIENTHRFIVHKLGECI